MKKNYTNFCWILIAISLLACTKQVEPIVTELEVVPKTFSINSPSTLTRPFTVRAKYSDNKVENVTKKVHWISENSSLIDVSANGELQVKNACDLPFCIISLVATHPESGKSQRVEVKLYPENKTEKTDKKMSESVPESNKDENPLDKNVSPDKPSEPQNEANAMDDVSVSAGTSDVFTETQEEPGGEPGTATSSKQSIPINFSITPQQLWSGQLYTPDVISEFDNSIIPPGNYSCVIEFSEEDVLVVENVCDLRALAPGKARLKLQAMNPQYVTTSILELEVLAQEVTNSQVNSLNFILDENQSQIWLKLLNVIPGEVIRYSVKGILNSGFQLFVLNSLQDNQGACFNTAPADSNEVACIVKPLFGEVYLVLHKPQAGRVMANVSSSVLPAEIMAYSQGNNADNPQVLLKDNRISSYVLANEFGLYNRHFYQYTPGLEDENGFHIVLTEFEAQPLIEIFWANGFCSGNMLKISATSISCEVPADREGNVWITVSGNLGAGMLNGSAAKKGGTYYSLLVTN